jgi:hypothetical protein
LKKNDLKDRLNYNLIAAEGIFLKKVKYYQDFLRKVEELGFMPFSHILDGLPAFPQYTIQKNWFTDDPDIDPWLWKYRAPQEKKLAFGNILGGQKGFISSRMYPVFYTAFHPRESFEERWEEGLVSTTTRKLWQLFENYGKLSTSDMRRTLGVTVKKGGSRLDASIKELQRDFYMTVNGATLKTDKHGRQYGWYENIYSRVLDWAPVEWRVTESGLSREEAKREILFSALAINDQLDRNKLAKKLGIIILHEFVKVTIGEV